METLRSFRSTLFVPAAFVLIAGAGCGGRSPVALNTPAPSLSLTTTDGAPWSLEEFRGQKIVVLGVGNPFG